jgi:hypothetical protein
VDAGAIYLSIAGSGRLAGYEEFSCRPNKSVKK